VIETSARFGNVHGYVADALVVGDEDALRAKTFTVFLTLHTKTTT
jgi:hypothetical protein